MHTRVRPEVPAPPTASKPHHHVTAAAGVGDAAAAATNAYDVAADADVFYFGCCVAGAAKAAAIFCVLWLESRRVPINSVPVGALSQASNADRSCSTF